MMFGLFVGIECCYGMVVVYYVGLDFVVLVLVFG